MSIARIRATIPGAVDEKLYEKLQMVVMLREGTEEASKAMDRFKLKSLLGDQRDGAGRNSKEESSRGCGEGR